VPWDLACERNWLSAEQLALTARQKSAEGIVGCNIGRRPERFPARGLKERRSCLLRNDGIASGESMGRKPGGWDEADVGAARGDAPVGMHGRCAVRPDLICRTTVYVTRSYGGVGGGGREAFPYPEWASQPRMRDNISSRESMR